MSRYFSFCLLVGVKENATYSLNAGGVFDFACIKFGQVQEFLFLA